MSSFQFNLYNTDQFTDDNPLEYDCLHYYVRDEILTYQELPNLIQDTIPYCIRSTDEINMSTSNFFNTRDQNFSFEELARANISAQQLISWSAPIDLTERYQLYLNQSNSSIVLLLNGLFYNCTRPWFGSRCQYSFELDENMSITDIVKATFSGKVEYNESSELVIDHTCYMHLKCDLGGSSLCLDWREVCDGRIDCFDGGLDETLCFDLEINECDINEYRCHNGLCIPEEFWEGGLGNADCLDRSDEPPNISYIRSCFRDPTFRCEEHSCRPSWHEFTCGDGQCVEKFSKCHNGRHALLIQSMSAKGNLSDKCWIAMVCGSMLVDRINDSLCTTWSMNGSIFDFLETCESLIQFPIIPIQFGHVRFLYNKSNLKLNMDLPLLPDYTCYDKQLCDFLTPDISNTSMTCMNAPNFASIPIITENIWASMILWINKYFRPCLTTHTILDDYLSYKDYPSMYHCENSSKYISEHRLVDGTVDCYMQDDETYIQSCSLNDPYRLQCPNKNICLSPIGSISDCLSAKSDNQEKVLFQVLCDHVLDDIQIENHTDESDCEYWPCDNIYSRCDGLWRCSDGHDENNCAHSHSICSPGTYACVSPLNHTLICLSANRVGNGIVDCLGAFDELADCRSTYPFPKDPRRFHCSGDKGTCISLLELCDNIQSCPHNDDENFCGNHRFICHEDSIGNRTLVEKALCQIMDNEKNRIVHFSIHTSPVYPLSKRNIDNDNPEWIIDRHLIENNVVEFLSDNRSWTWFCNRGLHARTWLGNDTYNDKCFCPPSYYGDRCQYQNQRVSLTLGFHAVNKRGVYIIVAMLIDDNDDRQKIDSYHQFVYVPSQSCSMKFNIYLLYSMRPKNISKNYSVRIDIFDKNTLEYHESWYLSIPFLFLPVNRLSTILHVPKQRTDISAGCSKKCDNGECVKYLNKQKYFCRCFHGWSGIQCDIPINCENCSPDSICVGIVNKRPICVCPITKFGPRCLLTSSCPSNACQNGAQCVPIDESVAGKKYVCICSHRFFGEKCQYPKGILDVSLNGLDIPSYVLAFFFTLSNQSEPTLTIMLQKLTLFQHTVTFHIPMRFHIVLIKLHTKYYLAVLQQYQQLYTSTSISTTQQCTPIEDLINSTLMVMPHLQRVKYYHILCQTYKYLNCFIDEVYLCLCTNEHHANCVEFDRHTQLSCRYADYCENGAKCLQDHPNCPSAKICVCNDCFFGSQCQFYAKGFGLTLDEILGYEIKRNVILSEQPISVKLSAIVTMIMFISGIINGIFSILTFYNKKLREVGCGIYLSASSITSILTLFVFTLKFWFLVFSHMGLFTTRTILHANCAYVEPLLKVLLYLDSSLNACVAVERAFSVIKGINFNRKKSIKMAKRVIISLIIIIIITIIPQPFYLHLFDDEKEKRTWCVIRYSPLLHNYSSIMILFHFFAPFFTNLFSALFIIIAATRQRASTKTKYSYWQLFKRKLIRYKNILISPIVLVILLLPRLIISFTLDCSKSSRHFWLYLTGYFISFIPSVLVFVVFVLPSKVYRKEFKETISRIKRHFFQ